MKVTLVQLCSTPNLAQNFAQFCDFMAQGAATGAELIVFPESLLYIGPMEHFKEITGEIQRTYLHKIQKVIKQYQTATIIGSLPAFGLGDKLVNRQYLFDPDGAIRTTYDKIHLFSIPGSDSSLNEANYLQRGKKLTTATFHPFTLGLTICYDLRFPELYRELVDYGVNCFIVPSAFTYSTGQQHWEILLRARAIENQSYILAPNQVGIHHTQHRSYGFTAVVEPNGTIQHLDTENAGLLSIDLDIDKITQFRAEIPALKNRVFPLN